MGFYHRLPEAMIETAQQIANRYGTQAMILEADLALGTVVPKLLVEAE